MAAKQRAALKPGNGAWDKFIDDCADLAITTHMAGWAWGDRALKVAPIDHITASKGWKLGHGSDAQRVRVMLEALEKRLNEKGYHGIELPSANLIAHTYRVTAFIIGPDDPLRNRMAVNSAYKLRQIEDDEARSKVIAELRQRSGALTASVVLEAMEKLSTKDREEKSEQHKSSTSNSTGGESQERSEDKQKERNDTESGQDGEHDDTSSDDNRFWWVAHGIRDMHKASEELGHLIKWLRVPDSDETHWMTASEFARLEHEFLIARDRLNLIEEQLPKVTVLEDIDRSEVKRFDAQLTDYLRSHG